MKKIKKLTSVMLFGAITLGIASCGANKNDNKNSSTESTNYETSSSTSQNTGTSSISEASSVSSNNTEASSSLVSSTTKSEATSSNTTEANVSTHSSSTLPTSSATQMVSSTTTVKPTISSMPKEENGITLIDEVAYTEGLYITFNCDSNSTNSDYTVSYTDDDKTYTTVDKELIRIDGNTARCDILGLVAGTYKVKVTKGSNSAISKTLNVTKDDRSGYAHFKNDNGIGAYNNDGSLKDNAIVVYVTDKTKNTVNATINNTECTGLVEILKAAQSENESVDIRILDEIRTQQWASKTHGTGRSVDRQNNLNDTFKAVNWEETTANELLNPGMTKSSNYYKIDEADIIKYGINTLTDTGVKYDANGNKTTITGITHLDGLTNNVIKNITPTNSDLDGDGTKGSAGDCEYDSYYNELDVKFGNNITVEGVGENAGIFQWGFCFNQCNSIEVKNLEFSSYTEDAVGIQGAGSDITKYSDYWIHNCTFNTGVNNWDVCWENDKMDGDGSTDFKYAHDLTISYTQYNGTHKTALIGSSDSSYQYNVTFHHNFYNKCGSRLPFTRQTNFHIYNCYYYGSTGTNMQINANAYALFENNYFEGTNKTFTTAGGGVIKLFNNVITSTSSVTGSGITYATNRSQVVANSCKADKVTDFSQFDIDTKLFYYDKENNVSDVELMLTPENAKAYASVYCGSGKLAQLDYSLDNKLSEPPIEDTTVKATYTTTIPDETANGGLYYIVNDGTVANTVLEEDLTNANTVIINEDESFTLNDTSSTLTTFAYLIFDEAHSTGTHTYSMTLDLYNVGSKWAMVQFLDGNNNLAIRSSGLDDVNKNMLAYGIDSKTETIFSQNTWTKKGKNYISLTINYDTNDISLTINGVTTKVEGYTATSIYGIQFMTAKSATDRTFTVSDLVIE